LRLEKASGQSPLHDVKDIRSGGEAAGGKLALGKSFLVVLPRFALLEDRYALK
jgi:hypothetical protein